MVDTIRWVEELLFKETIASYFQETLNVHIWFECSRGLFLKPLEHLWWNGIPRQFISFKLVGAVAASSWLELVEYNRKIEIVYCDYFQCHWEKTIPHTLNLLQLLFFSCLFLYNWDLKSTNPFFLSRLL